MDILSLMLKDLESAPSIYQPTNYWAVLLPNILEKHRRFGLERIKYHPHFVPIYRTRRYTSSSERFWDSILFFLEERPNRYTLAISKRIRRNVYNSPLPEKHYITFVAADRPYASPIIQHVSESELGGAKKRKGHLYEFDGKKYSKGMLKYLRGLAFLKKTVCDNSERIENVIEIGGGIGTLGEIMLKAKGKNFFYLNIDIPPMAYFSTEYLKMVFGDKTILDYSESCMMNIINIEEIRKKYRAAVVCPWQLNRINGHFDLFVNFTSFQEMEPDVVSHYVNKVSPMIKHYVLLMNRKCGQNVATEPGQRGVIRPITMNEIIQLFRNFKVADRNQSVFGDRDQEAAVLIRRL